MTFWLARKRTVQQTDTIQRFDPRFWTVDFPRPAVACVTTTAPDALRVDAVFRKADDLIGLIWESVDRWDHPLLAYETSRDYSRLTLAFRWQSEGVVALDAVNGPTLTIEGRDTAGLSRTWYVRLWNYATGAPTDAQVTLPFSALKGGFSLPGDADPVQPGDIDRMFISLAPPGYAPGDATPLAGEQNGWVELSGVTCQGHKPMLAVGDIMIPPHGLGIATGYDDSYNQTPARLLRSIRGLGYRGSVIHYIGMSHFFPLAPVGGQFLVDPALPAMNAAARAWHEAFCSDAQAMDYSVILSQSFEVLAQHCPGDWQQRAANGDPALTGYTPPSVLLSPAHPVAMGWLQLVARRLVDLQTSAGLPVRVQIGEPWWWVMPDHRICLYDAAAKAAFGGSPAAITDMSASLSAGQTALLDQAGAVLAAATSGIVAAIRQQAGSAGSEALLLPFLPTVLDPATPEARRANLPVAWAAPAFDVLQIEEYDWVTAGADAQRTSGRFIVDQRLGYAPAQQHYLSGYVADAAQAETHWLRIDQAATAAQASAIAEVFIWALPQVSRDGFTRLSDSPSEASMQPFDDVIFPISLGRSATVSPEFSTSVTITASGYERRNSLWSDARLKFDVGPGVRSEAELGELIAFFRARRGQARGFRLRDPADFSSAAMIGTPGPEDQVIGIGDGQKARFELVKLYGVGVDAQRRRITRPRADSVRLSVNGVETTAFTVEPLGEIVLSTTPAAAAVVAAGFLFDVPVRFAQDSLDVSGAVFAAGEAPSVPLIELREAD